MLHFIHAIYSYFIVIVFPHYTTSWPAGVATLVLQAAASPAAPTADPRPGPAARHSGHPCPPVREQAGVHRGQPLLHPPVAGEVHLHHCGSVWLSHLFGCRTEAERPK